MPPSVLSMADMPHTPFDLKLIPEAYQFLFRVSLFHDKEAGDRYADSVFPLRMFRAPSSVPRDPIPVPTQIPRGTGTNEEAWRGGLESLVADSGAFWGGKGCAKMRAVDLYPIDIEGLLDCIPNVKQCGGDNRDAAYFSDYDASYTLQPEGNSSFLLVTGVNHNASGKATYANVVVETAPQDDGVFNATCNGRVGVDSNKFDGTAAAVAPDLADPDMYFAFAVSRDCDGLRALAGDAAGLGCLELSADMVSGDDPLRVVTRAYLEKATATGPSYQELVWPVVSEFLCQ